MWQRSTEERIQEASNEIESTVISPVIETPQENPEEMCNKFSLLKCDTQEEVEGGVPATAIVIPVLILLVLLVYFIYKKKS